jgi:hypothetical protein
MATADLNMQYLDLQYQKLKYQYLNMQICKYHILAYSIQHTTAYTHTYRSWGGRFLIRVPIWIRTPAKICDSHRAPYLYI